MSASSCRHHAGLHCPPSWGICTFHHSQLCERHTSVARNPQTRLEHQREGSRTSVQSRLKPGPPHIKTPHTGAIHLSNHFRYSRTLRPRTTLACSGFHLPHHNLFHSGTHRQIHHTQSQGLRPSKARHSSQHFRAAGSEQSADDMFSIAMD